MNTPCVILRCPYVAVDRGRCALHKRSEEQRGYGREWRAIRRQVRGDACERCGTTSDLTVDHIVPQSLGGTNDPRNLRTLCRRCHAMIGLTSRSGGGAGSHRDRLDPSSDTHAPLSQNRGIK